MTKELISDYFHEASFAMFDRNYHDVINCYFDDLYISIEYSLKEYGGEYENHSTIDEYKKWMTSKRNDKINKLLDGQIELEYE